MNDYVCHKNRVIDNSRSSTDMSYDTCITNCVAPITASHGRNTCILTVITMRVHLSKFPTPTATKNHQFASRAILYFLLDILHWKGLPTKAVYHASWLIRLLLLILAQCSARVLLIPEKCVYTSQSVMGVVVVDEGRGWLLWGRGRKWSGIFHLVKYPYSHVWSINLCYSSLISIFLALLAPGESFIYN